MIIILTVGERSTRAKWEEIDVTCLFYEVFKNCERYQLILVGSQGLIYWNAYVVRVLWV
ncbi:MAG: hypothetical protein ACTSYC_01245 [Promethearchaeota archaeon]